MEYLKSSRCCHEVIGQSIDDINRVNYKTLDVIYYNWCAKEVMVVVIEAMEVMKAIEAIEGQYQIVDIMVEGVIAIEA